MRNCALVMTLAAAYLTLAAQAAQPSKPDSTFTSRAQAVVKRDRLAAKDARELLDQARQTDKEIAAYLAAHKDVAPELGKALYEGRPAIGMGEAELNLIGRLKVTDETAAGKVARFVVSEVGQPLFVVTLVNGKVARIQEEGAKPRPAPRAE